MRIYRGENIKKIIIFIERNLNYGVHQVLGYVPIEITSGINPINPLKRKQPVDLELVTERCKQAILKNERETSRISLPNRRLDHCEGHKSGKGRLEVQWSLQSNRS